MSGTPEKVVVKRKLPPFIPRKNFGRQSKFSKVFDNVSVYWKLIMLSSLWAI